MLDGGTWTHGKKATTSEPCAWKYELPSACVFKNLPAQVCLKTSAHEFHPAKVIGLLDLDRSAGFSTATGGLIQAASPTTPAVFYFLQHHQISPHHDDDDASPRRA
jgi:hypothetical protein